MRQYLENYDGGPRPTARSQRQGLGLSVAAAAAMFAATAHAQTSVYYGAIDATDKSQLTQWATHYWARVDNGTTLAPGSFAFTKAAMNDPLFLPVRGVRRTLETIGVVSAQACDGLTELQPGFGDVAVSDAFREAMVLWQFSTDAVTNPTGTQTHLNLINTSPSTSNTTWGMQGSKLVSTNLPWEPLTGANASGQMAGTVSTTTLDSIGKLAQVAPAIAKAAKGVTQAQSLITGEVSHAVRFHEGVAKFLADQGSTGMSWRVDAAFGVFGSLPLVGVRYDDAFVLIDAVDGTLDGPFDLASPLDATVLLAQHSAYGSGSTVRYRNVAGCDTPMAASWNNSDPCWFCTPTTVWNPPAPGGQTYFCTSFGYTANGTLRCVCTRSGTATYGTPPITVPTREVCDCGAPGAAGCGGGWTIGAPPGGCVNCTQQWFY